jgi:hypothetical protein
VVVPPGDRDREGAELADGEVVVDVLAQEGSLRGQQRREQPRRGERVLHREANEGAP